MLGQERFLHVMTAQKPAPQPNLVRLDAQADYIETLASSYTYLKTQYIQALSDGIVTTQWETHRIPDYALRSLASAAVYIYESFFLSKRSSEPQKELFVPPSTQFSATRDRMRGYLFDFFDELASFGHFVRPVPPLLLCVAEVKSLLVCDVGSVLGELCLFLQRETWTSPPSFQDLRK